MERAQEHAPADAARGTEDSALELLVHGVGGTTPEKMLDDPRTVRITGDDTAAVFRRAADTEPGRAGDPTGRRPVPEAYVWCNLTSGNGTRALWLLLLPFMVVNLAHWMRPGAHDRARTLRLYGLLVRLAGLSLTVLLVAGACEVALDLGAWQCAGTPTCAERHSWLGFLSPTVSDGGWWSRPGRRLALAALVPAALTGLLWYLSHRTWNAYESQRPLAGEGERGAGAAGGAAGEPRQADGGAGAGRAGEGDGGTALGRPGFWYGRRLVARLRAAHTAAGLLTVAAAVTVAAAEYDREPGGPAALDLLGRLLTAALIAGALGVVWVVCRRGRSERRLDRELDARLVRLLPLGALAVLILALVYAGWERPGWRSAGRLPGDAAFGAVVLAQGLVVIALALVAHALHRAVPELEETADDHCRHTARHDPAQRDGRAPQRDGRAPHRRTGAAGPVALRGLAGPAVTLLACALGGVMAGGVAQRVADWLDGTGAALPGPPVLLTWQASVIPPLLIVLLVVVAVLARRTVRLARAERAAVDRAYPDENREPARTRRIARVRALAALTDRAPVVVGVTAVTTLLLGAGALAGAWISDRTPGGAAERAHPFVQGAAETAQALGSWLIGLGFILFVTWGRRAYKDASARRTIGILWDVGTFWPRAAHPFAPPCYAERAVPDLTWRMTSWTRATGGRLVISGHSQGSVLAAAAVWQLSPADRGRVALLTYGSPLERLYGRWFPAHFGPAALGALHRELDCWRNLHRPTDPIGGPIGLPGACGPVVDRPALTDPLAHGRTDRHPLPAPILGHSDYQADPAFAEERRRLLARLRPDAVPAPRPTPAPERDQDG
ncbi:hypothetical protein [Streptomyces sp. enrichment culture]|uniref:hypothetical protein n=1 Tax=Streptomyces sp. enrichment culture TaxID=1795815 RepID=UPI003F566AF6